ncbi:response regulator transcription factor [Chitinophaga sp. S165]|uniref:response regulator transcription factor n=1 Tax=Chitinophaga sp. S165 TaxID=2135462 RepID=UPI000D71A6B9|nr:response regulator transcription factor [Chitinophaga sp. S165]PWV49587.1 LuxR family two component transcriptional regulator [Chitinophaga sp. S165]
MSDSTTNVRNVKIAIVDDHNLFRKGLTKLIMLGDDEGRYSILFEARDGRDLVQKLDTKNLPGILLIDVNMPGMDGYDTVMWLKQHHPQIHILVVSTYDDPNSVLRMLKLGVKGYLSKDIEIEDMHNALRAIAGNGTFYPEFVIEILNDQLNGTGRTDPQNEIVQSLSQKEREFIKLACTELTYTQIADRMFLSHKTVDGYREALFRRFNVKNRVSLVMHAIKHGIVDL